MAERHYTELVPERGEMCIEHDGTWMAVGARMVLFLSPGQETLAWFGDPLVDDEGQVVGWRMSGAEDWGRLSVADGYAMKQVRRDGDDMSVFNTPLGDGRLFTLERLEL